MELEFRYVAIKSICGCTRSVKVQSTSGNGKRRGSQRVSYLCSWPGATETLLTRQKLTSNPKVSFNFQAGIKNYRSQGKWTPKVKDNKLSRFSSYTFFLIFLGKHFLSHTKSLLDNTYMKINMMHHFLLSFLLLLIKLIRKRMDI